MCVVSRDSSSWGIEYYDNNKILPILCLIWVYFVDVIMINNVRDWVLLQLSEVLCVLTTYLTYKRPNIAQPSSSFFSQATLADDLVTFTASVQQDAFVLFVWLLPMPNTFHLHISSSMLRLQHPQHFHFFNVSTFPYTTILRTLDQTISFLSLLMNWRLT